MKNLTRRKFVKNAVITTAALPFAASMAKEKTNKPVAENIPLHWLDKPVKQSNGATWGVPWPKGTVKKKTEFFLSNDKKEVALQTWPLAYWPDGSLKWTAHALGAQGNLTENLQLKIGTATSAGSPLLVKETNNTVQIDTGLSGTDPLHSKSTGRPVRGKCGARRMVAIPRGRKAG